MNKLIALILLIAFSCSKEPKGEGISKSIGTTGKGELINGRKLPYSGKNYRYFSYLSFHVLNRAWVHEKVLKTTINTYKKLENKMPENKFLLMECSQRHGGKMWPHKTHQNGLSIDFATPLIKHKKPYYLHHHFGLFHYAMQFNEKGKWTMNRDVSIDFETMALHILELDKEARKNGLYVKKVIFKIDLKDDFYVSKNGKKVKDKGIYFARSLPHSVDVLHDEHYHVDFGFLQ